MSVTLPKDKVRGRRTRVANVARGLGIDVGEERRLYGANARGVNSATKKLINEGTPRTSEELLIVDAPPSGAFDGSNVNFGLSGSASGQNIVVIFTDDSEHQTKPLQKTTQNPPPVDGFFFDTNAPTQIVVGTPPAAEDMLIVIYKRG